MVPSPHKAPSNHDPLSLWERRYAGKGYRHNWLLTIIIGCDRVVPDIGDTSVRDGGRQILLGGRSGTALELFEAFGRTRP